MKVTVLCENSVTLPIPRGLMGEHGLAYFIEGDQNTLFDTGQGTGIINNAQVLGKNLQKLDRIILSHGHYDHTGGLRNILTSRNEEIPVYAHPSVFENKIAFIELPGNNIEIPIGMPDKKEDYTSLGARFEHTRGFDRLDASTAVISEVSREKNWKGFDVRLKVKEKGEILDDPFNDDLSVLLETNSGPVVLLGCAHAGIIEILNDLSKQSGHQSFYAVIGGTHLDSASPGYVTRAIKTLKKYNVQMIVPLHCTGFKRTAEIAQAMPKQFQHASVGSVFDF